MTYRDVPDALALSCAAALIVLAMAFLDKSYIVILSPIAVLGTIAMVCALALNRRWWLLGVIPFFAIPFISW